MGELPPLPDDFHVPDSIQLVIPKHPMPSVTNDQLGILNALPNPSWWGIGVGVIMMTTGCDFDEAYQTLIEANDEK